VGLFTGQGWVRSSPVLLLNEAYEKNLVATGGTQPYTWSVESIKEAIPDGWHLNNKGLLSGTPTKLGEISFSVQVTDSAGSIVKNKFTLLVQSPLNAVKKATKQAAGPAVKDAGKESTQEGGGNITPPPKEKPPQPSAPKLEDIFDFNKNLIGIFVALVFGLAPGLLFDRLQQQADRYKAELKSSQPTGRTQES
jgi:hypothetical protein